MIRTKIAVIAALCSLPLAAHAASPSSRTFGDEGSMEVGGTLEISSASTKLKPKGGGTSSTDDQTVFRVGPQAGYFLMDNLELLGGLSFGTSTDKVTGGSKSTLTEFGLNVGGGYYVKAGDAMRVGPDLLIGYASSNQDDGAGTKIDASGPTVQIGGTLKAPIGAGRGAVIGLGLHYLYENADVKVTSGGGSAKGTATIGAIFSDVSFTAFF